MNRDARARRSRFAEILTVTYIEGLELAGSVRLLFMVGLYGGMGLLLGYLWMRLDAETDGVLTDLSRQLAGTEPAASDIGVFAEQLAAWLADFGYDRKVPLLATGILQTSLWLLPLLLLFVGYDRVADDRHSRYTRYVLQRVHRESYLIGKILGHALVSLLVVLGAQAIWLALGWYYDLISVAFVFDYVPVLWTAFVVYVLAYSAYTMLMSTAFERPILALLIGMLLMAAIPIGLAVASRGAPEVTQVWLSAWSTRLLQLDLTAFMVFGAYGVGFGLLAITILRRVDL